MRCNGAKAKIQCWFDASNVEPVPPDVAEHIRVCANCRGLITRWNAIELRLQAMREESPPLSADFAITLRTRLREESAITVRPAYAMFTWRYALAGAGATAALVAILYSLSLLRIPMGGSQQMQNVAITGVRGDRSPDTR